LGTAACGDGGDQAGDGTTASPSPDQQDTQQTSATQQRGGECAAVIEGLSPRGRAADLLVFGVYSTDPAAAGALVSEQRVGGIFVGCIHTALFTDNALDRVQEAAGDIPVSVAVDDEGGRVQRIDELVGPIPSARQMAQSM